ncbi:hypothetical protein F5B18DRAFT_655035 [Nemania serpens]|nr:hypothetical protein F5B18DRAFT_655035 [Nemania serpens]
MAPPTREELANRERMIRLALARLDPQGQTPAVLRELIIELGANNTDLGGALLQASMSLPAQGAQAAQTQPAQSQPAQSQPAQGQQGQGQAQGQGLRGGRGRGRGRGRGQPSGRGRGSSGQ